MTDLRQGVGEMAHRALDELDMLAGDTSAPKEIGRAMAEIDVALITQCPFAAASRCTIAAAGTRTPCGSWEIISPRLAFLPPTASTSVILSFSKGTTRAVGSNSADMGQSSGV